MTKTKRGTPRRQRRPARAARPARRRAELVINDPEGRLAALEGKLALPGGGLPTPLSPEPTMSPTFVGTLKLGKDQIDALRRPTTDEEIEWRAAKKDGPEIIPYLSHNGYRDRLDAAFGLGGWGMIPVGVPRRDGESVFVPYALVVDGVPRVYAWGEQQTYSGMTYGDALEGTKSNAITRCGKELGIARELWNRKHVAALLERKPAGRRPRPEAGTQSAKPKNGHADGKGGEPITLPQRERLWLRAKTAGRTKTEVRMWLKASYGIDDSSEIKRRDYETIVAAIEKPGPLEPARQLDREPGEEG